MTRRNNILMNSLLMYKMPFNSRSPPNALLDSKPLKTDNSKITF